jgi:hypothetical protein
MNPSDAHSHLATLRQLKEMLDAGTLTPQEFEALKQQLVFGVEAYVPPTRVVPSPPVSPTTPEVRLPPSELPKPELAAQATENLDWLSAATPVSPTSTEPLAEATEPVAEADERRNPLTLVFILGGALALLALVLYLTLGNQSTDEHLTSTSQTAADSTATTPDIGPQTEQLTLPPAAPETIRVAPALPPAAVAASASKFRVDSAAATPTPSAPAKAAPVATPPKAAAPTTPIAVPDSAI